MTVNKKISLFTQVLFDGHHAHCLRKKFEKCQTISYLVSLLFNLCRVQVIDWQDHVFCDFAICLFDFQSNSVFLAVRISKIENICRGHVALLDHWPGDKEVIWHERGMISWARSLHQHGKSMLFRSILIENSHSRMSLFNLNQKF